MTLRNFLIRAAVALAVVAAPAAQAQPRQTLGWSSVFNNDYLGDGSDRWRSSSYTISWLRGPEWTGRRPHEPGAILEYRFRTSTLAPANLTNPAPGDRPYAGTLSFGLHTHFARRGFDVTLGGGIGITGPQTGHGERQRWAHEQLGIPSPSAAVLNNQIENAVYPAIAAEVARPLRLSDRVTVRPFLAAQAGVETLIRAGGDIVIGTWGQGDLLVREPDTGQFYTATRGGTPGLSLVLGGDAAWVADSHYLPSSRGYRLTDTRKRLRAGVKWQGRRHGVFYGVTWLGKEFVGQSDTQLVGTLNFRINF